MTPAIAERIKVVDADTHVSEPYDLWTSRVSTKWGDLVPHVVKDPKTGHDVWVLGGRETFEQMGGHPVGITAVAGWKEPLPSAPPTLGDADAAAYDPHARLRRMDEYGLYAQIIYPNVGGFGSGSFLRLKEPALMLECVRAYNDFLTDFCSADPKRLVALSALPFWDVDAAVKEMERTVKNGHRGVIFAQAPESFGQPHLADPHWNPIWETAQELGIPINFHIGSGNFMSDPRFRFYEGNGSQANYVKLTTTFFLDNAMGVQEVILSGICHRFPRLNFVSVESGVGWIPFVLASLDWQWVNSGGPEEHPEWGDMLPSDYFRRQIYGCFWFEKETARFAMDVLGPDHILFETDFPHPTCLAPGPATIAENPREHIEHYLGDLPEDVLRKILHDNAARLYRLD